MFYLSLQSTLISSSSYLDLFWAFLTINPQPIEDIQEFPWPHIFSLLGVKKPKIFPFSFFFDKEHVPQSLEASNKGNHRFEVGRTAPSITLEPVNSRSELERRHCLCSPINAPSHNSHVLQVHTK